MVLQNHLVTEELMLPIQLARLRHKEESGAVCIGRRGPSSPPLQRQISRKINRPFLQSSNPRSAPRICSTATPPWLRALLPWPGRA